MPTPAQIALAALRLSMAAFFAVWALEKILAPQVAARVAETFYGVSPAPAPLVATGVLQLALVAAFAAGVARLWTTAALLAIHTASMASTLPRLLDPYTPPNHLFWAGVPLIAALALLLALRSEDRFLTLDRRSASREWTQR
jgi:hypothetical protein